VVARPDATRDVLFLVFIFAAARVESFDACQGDEVCRRRGTALL